MGDYNRRQANRSSYIKEFTYNNPYETWVYLQDNSNTLTPSNKNANVLINKNLTVHGTIYGTIVTPSDIQLKDNIETLSLSLCNNLMNIIPKKYIYKNDKEQKEHYGFIAQELEEQLPILVNETMTSENFKIKTVNYLEMIPLLLLKIQNLQEQINELNAKLENK